jgi:hypothetical protein
VEENLPSLAVPINGSTYCKGSNTILPEVLLASEDATARDAIVATERKNLCINMIGPGNEWTVIEITNDVVKKGMKFKKGRR